MQIKEGLIVSIQGYSDWTTQELANKAIEGGAVAIRTDKQIKIDKPVIGLQKLFNKEFYITTSREAIIEVSKWANLIAIDSRKGNQDLELLYAHCHVSNIDIVADIENIDDVNNLLEMCNKKKINKPKYIATTFAFNMYVIQEIKSVCNIPIIAEGMYNDRLTIFNARMNGANNICIGTAISDIKKLTDKYLNYWEQNVGV